MTIKKKKRKAGSHAGEGAVIEEGVCGRFSNRQREKIYFTQQHLTKKDDEVSSDGSIYSRSAQLIDGSSHTKQRSSAERRQWRGNIRASVCTD